MSEKMRWFLACTSLAGLGLFVAGFTYAQPPEFSFWGNLPRATRMLEYSPAERTEPIPLVDPDKLAQCRVAPGDPLVLIRNGVLTGRGQVGEIRAGWFARAGDDRLVFFVPGGLPDSVAVRLDYPFPQLKDPEFDFFVIGDHEVRMLPPVERLPVGEEEFKKAALRAIEDGIIVPLDFPSPKWVEGRPHIPDLPDAVEWLRGKAEPVVLELKLNNGSAIQVMDCDPFFVRVQTADHVKPFFLRGSLDYFVEIDGSCYMVMRSGKASSGMWGYSVYRLQPNALPELVYSDGSWST